MLHIGNARQQQREHVMKFRICGRLAVVSTIFALGLVLPGKAQDAKTLVVSEWGYNNEALDASLFKPFEEKFGVKVVRETGNNPDRLNKLQIRGGVDVIFLTDAFSQLGIDAGVFAKIDPTKISNLPDLYPIARAPQGEEYGPAFTVGRYGIIYDSNAVSEPITSWKDLWRPALAGRVAIPGFNTSSGPMTVIVAGDRVGVDAFKDPDTAFASLAELKPNILKTYSSGSELVNLFSTGEVVVGALQDFAVPAIQAAIPSARWVPLDEGNFAIFSTANIAAKSTNQELALEFINWRLDPGVQRELALSTGDAAVNAKTELSEGEAKYAAHGEAQISALRKPDYRALISAKPDWEKRWNAIFGN